MINREQTHKEESILKGSPRERAGDFCMRATCNNGFFFVINDVAIVFFCFFGQNTPWFTHTNGSSHVRFICTQSHSGVSFLAVRTPPPGLRVRDLSCVEAASSL